MRESLSLAAYGSWVCIHSIVKKKKKAKIQRRNVSECGLAWKETKVSGRSRTEVSGQQLDQFASLFPSDIQSDYKVYAVYTVPTFSTSLTVFLAN